MFNTTETIQLFDLIINTDMVSKIILAILLIFSIISWALIFEKIFKFRMLSMRTKQFEKIFWSGQLLEDIYKKTRNGHKYPSAFIFNVAMQEWENGDVLEIVKSKNTEKKNSLKDRIYDLMSVNLNKSILNLRYGLGFLLIVASTSTLFGLLGTVWGIMQSFQSISLMQNVSLVTIAPGITNALITTIAGLITAIPALIAYYIYNNKISNFETDMENFELELLTILSRELEQ